ncbi:pleckstrin homology domain-containing family M member 3 [Scyliorhinus canicula]|uniref:pleckstrin homology domain-containing family M member 3 n=1 Tax=Scyliorhinus canicula TaxID=7830 RepID=UPI0018F289B1|nr:pleckstrin homology domain-containing family M member 3 [Scyliorhinus canicula]
MEALEADDISPALEATEEFFLFSGIDDQIGREDLPKREVFGIQEVPVIIGHEVLKSRGERSDKRNSSRSAPQKLSKSESAKQMEVGRNTPTSKPVRMANGPTQQWADGMDTERSFIPNSYGTAHTRKGNLAEDRSPNRPLLFRSQSDVVPSHCRSHSGPLPACCPLDSEIPPSSISFSSFTKGGNFATATQSQGDPQPLGRDVIKKGSLARRQDHVSPWKECYVELCSRELCLYNARTGDDCHLCNVYYLSCCQSITMSASHGDRVLEVLFPNGAWLQLQARTQREAEEWRQDLLTQMHALRLTQPLGLPNGTCSPPPPDWPPGTCQVEANQPRTRHLCTEGAVRIGILHMLMPQNNWNSYTFVLSQSQFKYFQTNDLQAGPLATYKVSLCLSVSTEAPVDSAPRLKLTFPEEVLILMADTQQEAQEWTEAIKAVINSRWAADSSECLSRDLMAKGMDSSGVGTPRNKRYSVTSSFLSLLTVIAVEKGLTAQSFRCAGECLHPLLNKKCAQWLNPIDTENLVSTGKPTPENNADGQPTPENNADGQPTPENNADGQPTPENNADGQPTPENNADGQLTPENNADGQLTPENNADDQPTPENNADGQLTPENNADGQPTPENNADGQLTPENKADENNAHGQLTLTVSRLPRITLTVSRPPRITLTVSRPPRITPTVSRPPRITPTVSRPTISDHAPHWVDLQVFEGKLTPFLVKINRFASTHVYSCSLCSQKGFICGICNNGQIIYPFEGTATKRCEICEAVFHVECKSRSVPCPRCVHRELLKKPRSFWRKLDLDDNFEICNAFEFSCPNS